MSSADLKEEEIEAKEDIQGNINTGVVSVVSEGSMNSPPHSEIVLIPSV